MNKPSKLPPSLPQATDEPLICGNLLGSENQFVCTMPYIHEGVCGQDRQYRLLEQDECECSTNSIHPAGTGIVPTTDEIAQAKADLLSWIYSVAGGLIADPAQFEAERQHRVDALIAAVSASQGQIRDRADCTWREGGDTRHCRPERPCYRCRADRDAARLQEQGQEIARLKELNEAMASGMQAWQERAERAEARLAEQEKEHQITVVKLRDDEASPVMAPCAIVGACQYDEAIVRQTQEIASHLQMLGVEPWTDGRSILDRQRPVWQHLAMIVSTLQARAAKP